MIVHIYYVDDYIDDHHMMFGIILFVLLRSNFSFPAFISKVDTKYMFRVLSIPSDPFQELFVFLTAILERAMDRRKKKAKTVRPARHHPSNELLHKVKKM